MVERSLHKAMVVGSIPTPATFFCMDIRPIGVLDSGVGGLTILKEIFAELPYESTIYLGDSLNAPYGKRSSEDILALAKKLITFLLTKDVKLVVIACNTITVNGIEDLRAAFPQVPIIGTVPVIKTAAQLSKRKKIGVLVTGATALSSYNTKLIQKFADGAAVTVVGTNKLVPLIEKGKLADIPCILQEELQPFIEHKVDTVVLGSTHFSLIQKPIQFLLGPQVALLHSGGAVARQTKRILENNKALTSSRKVHHTIFTTGSVEAFQEVAKKVLNKNIDVQSIVLQ